MHEKVTLFTPEFPAFLEPYTTFVTAFIAKQHINATPAKHRLFAKHLILEFYTKSGSLTQLEKDLFILAQ